MAVCIAIDQLGKAAISTAMFAAIGLAKLTADNAHRTVNQDTW